MVFPVQNRKMSSIIQFNIFDKIWYNSDFFPTSYAHKGSFWSKVEKVNIAIKFWEVNFVLNR